MFEHISSKRFPHQHHVLPASFRSRPVEEITAAVAVHHSRAPVVQTPGALVVTSNRAFLRLGCVRHFEPHEPLLIVTGSTGERKVAGATFEDRDQDTAALRIESDWQAFDQRKSERYICNLTAHVITKAGLWESAARVVNISQGGLAFMCREAPPVPDVVVVLSGDNHLPLPCRVVSKRSVANRGLMIGARFMGLGTGNSESSVTEAHASAFQLATGLTPLQVPPPPEAEEILGRRARR